MKKLLYIILSAIIAFSFTVPSFADLILNDDEIYTDEIETDSVDLPDVDATVQELDEIFSDEEYEDEAQYYNETPRNNGRKNYVLREIIVIVVALIIGLIVASVMKSGMKNIGTRSTAGEYAVKNSFVLSENNDIKVNETVDRSLKPKN